MTVFLRRRRIRKLFSAPEAPFALRAGIGFQLLAFGAALVPLLALRRVKGGQPLTRERNAIQGGLTKTIAVLAAAFTPAWANGPGLQRKRDAATFTPARGRAL